MVNRGAGENRTYLDLDDEKLLAECAVDKFRASGPGGQKRNKTDSGVRIRHLPTGVSATAVEDRSQHVNKRRALRRLRVELALEVRRIESLDDLVPSERLRSYMDGGGRLRISDKNPDFPAIVQELVDVATLCDWRTSEAAEALGLTTAQLVRFFVGSARLTRFANDRRAEHGHGPLRA